ncbi:TDT family transporter [Acinetobacter boissieri]|uniref:C4-dicarboxylate transporter/malic acid transport protein n=1 Tax=Acinetobacter boissieri TaxID=1219383 RepID=A0A1G6HF43_9GAMM|nr:TDT family transporter [Acinetobacter boissieri]SDB92066.1 C4-dicarboxylate transporter/malic acid transport protein [Acinetobacter boissieri]
MKKPFYMLDHKINLVRHFTPNWFTATMGTGVVSLVISELPLFQQQMFVLGYLLWLFNILLFVTFSVLYTLRWFFFYHEAKLILKHSSMLFFLGAIPMGLATIINGTLKYGIILFGDQVIVFAHTLWYIDAVIAVFVAIFVPAMMFTQQKHELHGMTAIWLLPIVTAEVCASSGGILIGFTQDPLTALTLLIISYILWGISILPAFSILTILFLRMALHKLPDQQMAISSCLALGPIGTGALALLLLGKQSSHVFILNHLNSMSDTIYAVSILGSLVLIGFGFWWLAIAIFTIYKQIGHQFKFNLGWWGLTFPFGVYTLAILELGKQLHFSGLIYIGYSFAYILITLWIFVFLKTLFGAYKGILFLSPCLILELNKKNNRVG